MKDFKQKADNAVFVAPAIGPWGILMLIVAIAGLVKCCVTKPPDLTEESINKSGNIVEHVIFSLVFPYHSLVVGLWA